MVLFGAATDSYDAVGKVVSRSGYAHVTRELVESKLADFRGKIMQKPSVFSALKVDGKKMYEYARAGEDIPEVPARPVEVHELELVDWLEPGTHEYAWPKEEVDGTEKAGAEKLMGIRKKDAEIAARRNRKRSRSPDEFVTNADEQPKKTKTDSEPAMSGALPASSAAAAAAGADAEDHVSNAEAHPKDPAIGDEPAMSGALPKETDSPRSDPPLSTETPPQPPAARLRMTVTSGFYVRSLCHDLGLACDSLGLMSSLIRSRQGDYSLGKNVLEYSDLEAGPAAWEPKVRNYLEDFMEKEGWEAEEVESEDEWQARRKELEKGRRDSNRERSFHGGGGWKKGKRRSQDTRR